MIISKSILKKQLKHTSKDQTKPSIMGILINGNKTVATDGYRLSIIEYPKGIDCKAFMSNNLIKDILKSKFKKAEIKANPELDCIEIDSTSSSVIISWHYSEGKTTTSLSINDANIFPPYEQCIPKDLERKNETIGLNTRMLGDLIAEDFNNLVSFEFYGALNPIIARSTVEGLKVTNVLMPIRLPS